jgi:hypothetical protein
MNTLEGLPLLNHYNLLLSTGKEEHAWKVLQEFFSFFDKDSPKDRLWFMLVMALKSETDEISAADRANMIFFYEYCIALFKAAALVSRKRGKGKRRV